MLKLTPEEQKMRKLMDIKTLGAKAEKGYFLAV